MIANGHPVAVIAYHGSDQFNNPFHNSRRSYYGVTGNPIVFFDGGNSVLGGISGGNMYSQYSGPATAAAAVPSSFELEIDGTGNLIDYDITVTVRKVASYSGGSLVLHLVVTESQIPYSWYGLPDVNHVCRLMVPGSNGTSLDFSASDTLTLNFSFSLDPEWVTENCELIAFIQDNSGKQILQGTMREMMEFGNVNAYDASVTAIENMPKNVCFGELEPWVTIRNNGNENLTSVDIQYNVNGGTNSTYSWTGNLAILESDMVLLPSIAYTPEEDNILTVYTENPNGNPDQYPPNDTLHVPLEILYTPVEVNLFIRTDNNPEENTWELTGSDGSVLYSGGPYSTAGATISESFVLDPNECYGFTMYDAGGDGFQQPGFFFLYYGNNQSILQGFEFGDKLFTEFHTESSTTIDERSAELTFKLYPNPANDLTNILFSPDTPGNASIRIYNILGEEVSYRELGLIATGEQLIQVNTDQFTNGMYFIQLQVGNQQVIEKMTISR